MKPRRLINESAVRKTLLEVAREKRPFNKFKRVSARTLAGVNLHVLFHIEHLVHSAPSRGKTL